VEPCNPEKYFDVSNIHIGIDLDHTIINYQQIFTERAFSLGYTNHNVKMTKEEVKKKVKKLKDGEKKWGLLQMEVYTDGISEAIIMEGFSEFVNVCKERGISLSVISHKSRNNPQDAFKRDLQESALDWMNKQHFFEKSGFGFSLDQVFFAETIEDKVARIKILKCSHFVDDLLKVLLHPCFPESTRKILYTSLPEIDNAAVDHLGDWSRITKYLIPEMTNAD